MQIEAAEITFRYPFAEKRVLDALACDIQSGTPVVISGHNGSGKSTLGKVLCGVIPHFETGQLTGKVAWNGQAIRANEIAATVCYLFQNPNNYFVERRVLPELAAVGGVPEALRSLGQALLPFANRNPPIAELSLGQRQRLAIVSVLSGARHLRVLDEPLSFLDDEGRELVLMLATEVARMGSLVICLDSRPLAGEMLAAEWRRFTCAEGKLIPGVDMPGPWVEALAAPSPAAGGTCLSLRRVGVDYGGKGAFRIEGVDLDVRRGECVGLCGPNGAGKTSLLRRVAGIGRPGHGVIRLDGRVLEGRELRRSIRYVAQDPDWQTFAPTIEEELSFGQTWRAARRPYHEVFADYGIEAYTETTRSPFALSYGERKFLCFLSVLALEPGVMALDEPFAGLDPVAVGRVAGLLRRFLQRGGMCILAAHDRALLGRTCHRTAILSDGRVVDVLASNRGGTQTGGANRDG